MSALTEPRVSHLTGQRRRVGWKERILTLCHTQAKKRRLRETLPLLKNPKPVDTRARSQTAPCRSPESAPDPHWRKGRGVFLKLSLFGWSTATGFTWWWGSILKRCPFRSQTWVLVPALHWRKCHNFSVLLSPSEGWKSLPCLLLMVVFGKP